MAHSFLFGLYEKGKKPERTAYHEAMDGDPSRTQVVDKTPDGGAKIFGRKSGRWIKPDFVPTKAKRGGVSPEQVPMLDVDHFFGTPMVPQEFKDILEEFEPGVHQFFPLEVFWKGEKIADRYWFIVGSRLDVYHPELVYPLNERGFYAPKKGEPCSMVYSKDLIGEHHAWAEKYTNSISMSDPLVDRLKQSGMTGMVFYPIKEA